MPTLAAQIQSLQGLRREFGAAASSARLALLKALVPSPADPPSQLAALHEELLFLCAYPDTPAVLSMAECELRKLAGRIRSQRFTEALRNSGIANTPLRATFSSELLEWIDARFASAVRPAWEKDSLGEGFDALLPLIVDPAEQDGLQYDRTSTREWLRAARGRQRELQWIVARLREAINQTPLRDHVLDAAELPIEWTTLPWRVSRSGLRFPARPAHFHQNLLRDVSLRDWLSKPLPRAQRLSRAARRELLATARLTLAVRERETDPVTYGDEREVTLFRLERGVDVALFGMLPNHRLPIESYFGFVAAKNRVPIAYGGGWVFFDRCEIGVNLFDTFRGGESALIFSQVMRVYHHHYRATRFTVAPYQFGAENDEAIRSGAFWFYHRLGFLPADVTLRKLAEREVDRIAGRQGYRTPATTLRRFAQAPLELLLSPQADSASPLDLSRISFAVSRWVGRKHGGSAQAANRAARLHLRTALNLRLDDDSQSPRPNGQGGLLLLFGALAGIENWTAGEREALRRIYTAKSRQNERAYALAVQKHKRLRAALAALVNGAR